MQSRRAYGRYPRRRTSACRRRSGARLPAGDRSACGSSLRCKYRPYPPPVEVVIKAGPLVDGVVAFFAIRSTRQLSNYRFLRCRIRHAAMLAGKIDCSLVTDDHSSEYATIREPANPTWLPPAKRILCVEYRKGGSSRSSCASSSTKPWRHLRGRRNTVYSAVLI